MIRALAAKDGANMHDVKSADAALAIEGLSHWYGSRQALDDVTFSLKPATFTVLLGLNGAGKSTLFSLVTRLYAVRRGRIRVFDYDVGSSPGEALRRLGVVFQPRTLDLDLSVLQNLRYHAALHGIGAREARLRAEAMLARVHLPERADDKVRNLSGGQMRRVEIARALLHRPQLLVLDEPTVGLDIKARAEILDHVHGLVAEEGVCVLWATHLVDEIAEKDDVIVLHLGKVLAHGPASVIVAQAGAADIRGAFGALTSVPVPGEAA
jgi:ABC-2 type transport system ATP-binding protein